MNTGGIFKTVVVGACPRCKGQVVGVEDVDGRPTLVCLQCGWVDDVGAKRIIRGGARA